MNIVKPNSYVTLRCVSEQVMLEELELSSQIGQRLDLPSVGFGEMIGPEVEIGDDAIIFHNVTIGHAKPGPIAIGDRVYIGTAAIILGPVKIGNDVTIGANVTITQDIPDGATVVAQKPRILLPEGPCEDSAGQ